MSGTQESLQAAPASQRYIKCVVWDLDNTLWNGVLLEGDAVVLRQQVRGIIEALDSRGILQSIASKNDNTRGMAKLKECGLHEYFVYPQINWNSKASSIEKIAELINIGIDSIAFIDDDPYEREEVSYSLPQVLCIDGAEIDDLLDIPEMNPRFLTEDSRDRRLIYIRDIERNGAEQEFIGPKEEFLATLGMVLEIGPAREEDLKRAEELTVRTHQLNSTGYTYSYDDLNRYRTSGRHKLLIAGLDDKYGSYGKIGLALIECSETAWTLKLLLMSCRVMSRGVGTILINTIMDEAKAHAVLLRAEFVPTDRNRIMYITYKFAGFQEVAKSGNLVILENDLSRSQPRPEYVRVRFVG